MKKHNEHKFMTKITIHLILTKLLNYQFYHHLFIYTKSSVLFSLIYTSGILRKARGCRNLTKD